MTLDCTCTRLKEAEAKAAKWDGIARCGECVYGDIGLRGGIRCAVNRLTWESEFFCALGKRREDA